MRVNLMLIEVNWRSGTFWKTQAIATLSVSAYPLVNGKRDEEYIGGGEKTRKRNTSLESCKK